MVSVLCAKIFEIPNAEIKKSLEGFQGVEHRMEYVAEKNGITYINDSKATNIDATFYALEGDGKTCNLDCGAEKIREIIIKICCLWLEKKSKQLWF